jgi:hypothetical protein
MQTRGYAGGAKQPCDRRHHLAEARVLAAADDRHRQP